METYLIIINISVLLFTIMVLLHYNAERVNNILENVVWKKRNKKAYNAFLEKANDKRKSNTLDL